MPKPPGPQYTSGHEVNADGSVDFACSTDVELWPWLALPPQHPIVLQTQNFWSSIGASDALGNMDPDKWSALTWTDWVCGPPDCGPAVRGHYRTTRLDDDKLAFQIVLFDAADRTIATMLGKGVVFRTRNFEQWRDEAKHETEVEAPHADFTYADRALLNLTEREQPLVGPLVVDNAEALITKANGLPPGHPYFSGSGDHVNSTHLAEAARQVASLVLEGAPFRVTGGEMDMRRYIELGCPFRLVIEASDDDAITLALSQLDKDRATISLRFERL
ncbi:hypothetical protein [Parerythrobacter aestuarii]|uniref:hypothetical protein n=1 Tax=Parerythrobacter aestuarii TaxID=3020909 RepID=UPI0024DEABB8|nr:hypothetical protein [Parerythrobacter aestuarii]